MIRYRVEEGERRRRETRRKREKRRKRERKKVSASTHPTTTSSSITHLKYNATKCPQIAPFCCGSIFQNFW
jgi:hypothetical protein